MNTATAGGAIASTGGSIVSLVRSRILSNNAFPDDDGIFITGGGAVFADRPATFRVIDSLIDGNDSYGSGGGLLVTRGDSVIEGSTFVANRSDARGMNGPGQGRGGKVGGAIAHGDGSLNLIEVVFREHVAAGSSAAGGAVFSTADVVADTATFIDNASEHAGGALALRNAAATFRGSLVSGNVAGGLEAFSMFSSSEDEFTTGGVGGGVHVDGGSFDANDSTFTRNVATLSGGAVHGEGAATSIRGGRLTDNSGGFLNLQPNARGGAIFSKDGELELTHVDLGRNSVEGRGVEGGAVFAEGRLTIDRVNFEANQSSGSGSGLRIGENSEAVIVGSSFVENGALLIGEETFGGGVSVGRDAGVRIEATRFESNVAASGGGLHNEGGRIDTRGTAFVDNVADWFADDPDRDGLGGGIWNESGTLVLVQATLQGNVARGLREQGGGLANEGSAFVEETVFTGNRSGGGGGLAAIRGELVLHRVTLGDNVADSTNFVQAPAGGGGGLLLTSGNVRGTQTIIDGNLAEEGGGVFVAGGHLELIGGAVLNNAAARGGGVIADIADPQTPTWVAMVQTTVHANDAEIIGGGVLQRAGLITMAGVTLADNVAGDSPGVHVDGGVFATHSSIYSDNIGRGADLIGEFDSRGFNLIESLNSIDSVDPSDLIDVDRMLDGLLADDGMPVRTIHADSPARGATPYASGFVDSTGVVRGEGPYDFGATQTPTSTPSPRPGRVGGPMGWPVPSAFRMRSDGQAGSIAIQSLAGGMTALRSDSGSSVESPESRTLIYDALGQRVVPADSDATSFELDREQRYLISVPPSSTPGYVTLSSPAGGGSFVFDDVANLAGPVDSNGDGQVTPLDALKILNHLRASSDPNRFGDDGLAAARWMLDSNADGEVDSLDALMVLNHLRRRAASDRSEPVATAFLSLVEPTPDRITAKIASDDVETRIF